MYDPRKVVIFGCSGHAKVVVDILESNEDYKLIGFIDKFIPENTNILNYKLEGVKKIEVYDMLGQKLISEKAVGRVNISALTKGTYILKLMGENGSVSTKRFTKK